MEETKTNIQNVIHGRDLSRSHGFGLMVSVRLTVP